MNSKIFSLTLALTLSLISIPLTAFGASESYSYCDEDVKIFNHLLQEFESEKDTPSPILFTKIAKHFLKTPYQAGTLELIPEQLVVNLRETDCILFIEMCTALTLTIKGIAASGTTLKESTFELYCENLKNLRYRNGVMSGYESRLHYTSEWIHENQEKGIFQEITNLYGEPINQKFSFMSSNPEYYAQLRNSSDMIRKLRLAEQDLNDLGPFYSIPKVQIEDMSSNIRDGDIICFVTNVEGLDVSHVGIAVWVEDELRFIHASSIQEEVVIDKKTLEEYTKTGIRIVRFQ